MFGATASLGEVISLLVSPSPSDCPSPLPKYFFCLLPAHPLPSSVSITRTHTHAHTHTHPHTLFLSFSLLRCLSVISVSQSFSFRLPPPSHHTDTHTHRVLAGLLTPRGLAAVGKMPRVARGRQPVGRERERKACWSRSRFDCPNLPLSLSRSLPLFISAPGRRALVLRHTLSFSPRYKKLLES